MGFWKAVGGLIMKVGSTAVNEGKAATERSQQYKSEMPSKSDSELLQILKKERSTSPLKAGSAVQELKKRGYSPEQIKEKTA